MRVLRRAAVWLVWKKRSFRGFLDRKTVYRGGARVRRWTLRALVFWGCLRALIPLFLRSFSRSEIFFLVTLGMHTIFWPHLRLRISSALWARLAMRCKFLSSSMISCLILALRLAPPYSYPNLTVHASSFQNSSMRAATSGTLSLTTPCPAPGIMATFVIPTSSKPSLLTIPSDSPSTANDGMLV